MTATAKLCEISSPGIGSDLGAVSWEFLEQLGDIGIELNRMLEKKNGFYAFESALHVFPAVVSNPSEIDLLSWNDGATWRSAYCGLADGCFFFAENAFADQFCVKDKQVFQFDAETAELTYISDSLEQWAEKLLNSYKNLTLWPMLKAWQSEHGAIPVGHRLIATVPFVLGGKYELSNYRTIRSVAGMKCRGNLAAQIHALPDGTPIKFEIID